MKIAGIVLIILGVLAFVYQGFTYVTRETVVDAGPVKITADRERTVPLPPIVGGVAVLAGAALIFASGRRSAA